MKTCKKCGKTFVIIQKLALIQGNQTMDLCGECFFAKLQENNPNHTQPKSLTNSKG